ncbi:hypothetical protein ACCO45_006377 [Purpureocillium lilacinum]|uniref:Uncharacterized protein n=1 Tax=Purpureocillium lilacinum TaxID=33203 RepID=A0ACC4DPB3_PURLI
MRLVRLIALGALALGVASAPAITHDLDLDHALQHDQHNGHSSSCYHSDTSKGIVVLTKCRRTTTHRSKTRSSSSTSCPRATTTTAPPNSTTTGPATTTTTASVDMCDKGGECDCSCIPDVNSEEYGLLLRYQSLPRQRTDSRARSRDGDSVTAPPESRAFADTVATAGDPAPARPSSAVRGRPRAVNVVHTTVVSVVKGMSTAAETPKGVVRDRAP